MVGCRGSYWQGKPFVGAKWPRVPKSPTRSPLQGSADKYTYNQVALLLLAVLVVGWVVGLEPLAADCIGQNDLASIWWGLGFPIPLRLYDLDPTG